MSDEITDDAAVSDSPVTTDDLLRQLLDNQANQRAEVADLRKELAEARERKPTPAPTFVALSPEEARTARLEEVAQHDFYCPGCGKLYDYRRECQGRSEAPHPPIEVVSTDELKGENADDGNKHTAAPGVNP